jgi:uncharacterized repeat protein (TIGR01451 family)
MPIAPWSWRLRRRRRPRADLRLPTLEWLEDRTLLSGSTLQQMATPLTFTAFGTAQATHFLSDAREVDLYEVTLHAGDQLRAGVSAQTAGSGLTSLLRIFNADGTPVAMDDQEGGDPGLTFQAPATLPAVGADYFIGVSSAPNDNYDPAAATSGTAGGTTGLYTLNLRDTPLAPGKGAQPDVAGSSFRLDQPAAAWGDTISGTFRVENRGGATSTGFTVQVVLSSGTRFDGFDPSQALAPNFTLGPPVTLAAGKAYTDRFTAQLPAVAPANFPASGPVYVGLLITPNDPAADSGTFDKSGVHRGEDFENLTILTPVPAGVTDLSQADPNLSTRTDGTLSATTQVDTDPFTVSPALGSGRLTVEVKATTGTLVPRLGLSGPGGLLIQSDDGAIVQHLQPLPAGQSYSLAVSAQSGTGSYQLTTEFVQADPPLAPLGAGAFPSSVAVADVNGDGIPDLVVANYTSYRDSTHRLHVLQGTVSVLLGNGDGSFRPDPFSSPGLPPGTFAVGKSPTSVAVADLDGDGKLDLVVTNYKDNTVSVLLGNGDGSFQTQQLIPNVLYPRSVAVADVNGDGIPDLVVANDEQGGTVSVLPGNGDGTFGAPQTFAVGPYPRAVAVRDFNGDGKPDLVVANTGPSTQPGNTVSVLRNTTSPGASLPSFAAQQTFVVGSYPRAVAVADLAGDGRPDIVTANYYGNTVSVLQGDGHGSFAPQQTFAVGTKPDAVAVADVNGDGRPDLVVANRYGQTVGVLLGNGDGTFGPQQTFTSPYPSAVAVADLDGDGRPDIAVANYQTRTVSVLLGTGDGSFRSPPTFAVGAQPTSVVVADVNGDGKPDLVTTNYTDNTVSVLLGNGDGTFGPPHAFAVGPLPEQAVVADLNGDGKPDIVTANYAGGGTNDVSVLLGNGDGTFGRRQDYPAGAGAAGVEVTDVNGDGKPDLVVGHYPVYTQSLLLGNGDGTFGAPTPDGSAPASALLADVDGDGTPDLVASHYRKGKPYGTVTVELHNSDGTVKAEHTYNVGKGPNALRVADLGNGHLDLMVADRGSNSVSVLLGAGDGTFPTLLTYAAGLYPDGMAVADVNGDGKPDLVVANEGNNTVSVLLGHGDGTFSPATPASGGVLRNTPYLANLTGDKDGTLDAVVLDRSGNLLFRKGLSGAGNPFAPPVPLNDKAHLDSSGHIFLQGLPSNDNQGEDRPARDLTVLTIPKGEAIATADSLPDPHLSGAGHFVYTVSLYTLAANGSGTRTTAFTTTLLPTRIVAGDLTDPAGTPGGLDELIVANSLDNSVTIAFLPPAGMPPGTLWSTITRAVGVAPSDITVADVDGDGLPDIVVSDQAGGDVTVLYNDPTHSFTRMARFRASTGLSGLDMTTATPAVASPAQSVSLVANNFTSSGRQDLVVVNRGTHSFSVLPNDGNGGFHDPQAALTTSTSDGLLINNQPGPVVAGAFNNANNNVDLAVLMEDRGEVWIYTGNGDGTFTFDGKPLLVGNLATGLSLAPGSGAGKYDLVVGDQFGDVQRLEGDGRGSFLPFSGDGVPLAVQTLADHQPEVLLADQATDSVALQTAPPGSVQFRQAGALPTSGPQTDLAPGAVTWAKLEGDASAFPDAVVIGTGSNDVLVYHFDHFDAGGQPVFDPPQVYVVGTHPVSVTIQDVKDANGAGVPDLLVADQGSNDVATLFGSIVNGQWAGTPGPRLKTGGTGPVAVNVVSDPHSPDGHDLVVTNGQSGTMTVLPGIGQGFFNDQSPQTLAIPGLDNTPIRAVSFAPDSGQGVAVIDDGRRVVGINLNDPAAGAGVLFTSPADQPVLAVQDQGNGSLAIAEEGGTVAILEQGAGGLVEQTLTPLTGIPSDPSALAVLGDEVLVTNAGEDQVFVYEPPATFVPGESGTLPPQVPGAPVSETATPGAAPLAAVTTLTVSLIPPLTTMTTEVFESGVFAANPGIEVVANVGEDTSGTVSNIPIQGATDDTDEQPDATAGQPNTPESNFGLGIEEKLRQLELRKKGEDKPDGPSSRRAPGEWPAGRDVAVFWQEGDADWLSDMPLDTYPERDQPALPLPAGAGSGGGKELPPFAADPAGAVWLSLPDEVIEAVRQTGSLSRQGGEQPVRGADSAPVEVPVRTAREGAEPEVLVTLALAGLACWVEKKEKARTAGIRPQAPGV